MWKQDGMEEKVDKVFTPIDNTRASPNKFFHLGLVTRTS